jgi:exonuclease III
VSKNASLQRTNSQISSVIELFEIQQLWNNYKVDKTIPDGHCLLNSVVNSVNYQLNRDKTNINELIQEIYKEVNANIDRYEITTCGSKEIFIKQLDDYIKYRKYNCDVCDIMPYIISNALSISLFIVECRNNVLNYHLIGENTDNEVCLIYKKNDHYDSIVPYNRDALNVDYIRNDSENNEMEQCKVNRKQNVTKEILRKEKIRCNCNDPHICICKMKAKFDKHHGFNIAQINCRSLFPKLDEIAYMITKAKIDILCLTETWLDESVLDSDILIDGYMLFRKDRGGRGGGVAIYVRDNINFIDRSVTLHNGVEAVLVEIVSRTKNPNILLTCMYRPPNCSADIFDNIVDYIEKLFSENKEVVILGDLNYDYKFDETLSENPIHLIENLFGMKQLVQSPTRVSKNSSTLLDVILTSCPQYHVYTGVQDISLSDHFMTYTILDISHKVKEHREVCFRNFMKFKHEQCIKEFNDSFSIINDIFFNKLSKTLDETTIDECWEVWKSKFLELSDKYVPFTIRRLKNRSNPWITPDIVKLIYQREYLHKKALKATTDEEKNTYWSDYKKARNLVTKTIRKAKLEFYSQATKQYHNNSRKLWSYIRQAIPKQTNKTVNNITADKFNDFFATVGQKVAANCDSNISQYKCSLQQSIYKFKFQEITEDIVKKYMLRLPNTSNNDIFGFDSKLLNFMNDIITPSLTALINASLQFGYLPPDWKTARVTPAYKGKGEFNNENNYRPLSVIAHVAKVVELCVQRQLVDYLYKHNFISIDQFAYLKNHSTHFCLHRLLDDILENVNDKEITGMCFLDIRKCFDTIDHEILLLKMSKYGILDSELNWFHSYLKERSQVVAHNGISDKRFVNIGVPQGTVLGPILFLMYVNDLSNVIKNAQINIFADDVVVYTSDANFENLKLKLQNTMNDVFMWYTTHKLSLSLEKCTTMVIQNAINAHNRLDIRLGDTLLEQVKSMKYLGTIIDEDLKWNEHLNALARKININNARLRRVQSILPLNIRCKIHNALNVPVLDYASTVWGSFSCNISKFISRLEHMSARALSGNYDFFNVRGESLMADLNMRSFEYRLRYHKALLMFKAIHGLVPNFLMNYILFNYEISQRNLRSFDNMTLYKPKPNCEKFKKSLMYSGPEVWNTLPLRLKEQTSVDSFKRMYKKLVQF